MAAVSRLLLKRRDSWVANQRLMVLMDNGRTPGLQISWPGFRGSCTMYFVPQSRQKEDEEVSSQATTLQFGSPGKSRGEEYVCPGHPHCEKGKGKDEVKRETWEEMKARITDLQ